ncbi:hypothetical protein V7J24_001721, partial [Campylobacter upsaliensis]
KEVLDRPEAIMRDDMGEYLFIKHLKDDDYFVNVSFDNGEYLVSISNGIKETRNLNNKLKKGGEFIYQSPNFNFISQKLLQTSQYSANKIDEDIIAQNAKSERAEFESFKDKMKELYAKYEGLNHYDKSASQLKSKLLNEEIKPEIKKEFKNIIDKFKGADNKDKMLRVIKENKEELSDYLAFHIALRKDIYIDGYGEGRYDFYDKSIRGLFKFRENKPGSEIYDDSNYRTLAALENLSNKNTSLYFSFRDLNGKVGEFKTYPRIQDLLFYDLLLVDDLKNAVILSTKDKHLKEKLIEKLKAYIDKKIYADFLGYKIKDLESRNPKNSYFENYKDEKWDEEALKSFKKELEDLRANEKGTKLEAKGSEDIFTDKKGKEHTLTKETQKAWLEAFNLKSLEEAYIPNFKAEVKEAINRVLGGEEIKLTEGSFEKLLKRDREEFLPYIKDTLEKADLIIKDKENALIFVKDIGKKSYFTSVAKNANNEWVISTNSLKTLNTLKNRVDDNGEVLYLSKEAPNILAEAFTKRAFSNELAKDIIPQQKIKFAMEKFHYDEKKAKDLLEWHKNSHALTKDENGLPKVFYHGTYSKFRVFRRVGKASGQGFFFTPSQKATEEYGDITLNTFLNIKNPFRADELKINKEADLQKWADILKLDYDKEKYESFKDLKTKLEKVKEATKKAGFKFHSASGGGVYVIDNKGRNSFINLEELDKENKRVVEAFKGLETEDIYFYYVVRNEFDLVLYALNKNDRYFHTSGRDEVKRVLEKLGYDGVVLNDTIITAFNSNQIKHIDNKGSFTDTKGNVTSKKPKDKEAEFSYFNEKSDNIYHSNPHLGAGLVGGVLNGVEQDENGNLSFDPVKFAAGFLGGSVGSFALKKGFQILEKNPELKEKIITELAHTLAQGFEKAREKYPLLSTLEPRYIVKNEKGRKIQAKTMLKELEREQKGLYNVAFNGKNASLIKKDLEAVDEAILFEKGTKRKGGKHIRLAHSTEPSQEGYVTKQEVANLGVNIREYLKNYEPFIDKNGARLYEWKDENGVKFRAVVNNTQTSGGNSHLPSASEEIITFYSDRNLKEKMNFKNPLLKDTIAESTMQGE